MPENSIEKRARFDIIRYSNCWEDADILLEALQVKAQGAYLSIASAGDNSLSLLSRGPKVVLAVDISPAQIACLQIRKAAFQKLSYDELLRFLGVLPAADRPQLYLRVRPLLPEEAGVFWDERADIIRRGIIHCGKFERYFSLFRRYVLPLIHSRRDVERLLSIADSESRARFYTQKWNTVRWKMLFRVFFSRMIMGKLGRDPEFFKYVESDVSGRIFKRAEYALTVLPTDKNPYLEYILTGNYRRALPFYLRKENFESIRANIDRLIIFKGTLQQAFLENKATEFDGFNLSDIFEYMDQDQYRKELAGIFGRAKSQARIVYWNMLADRKEINGMEGKINFLDSEADELFKQDKAFFYKALIIVEIPGLICTLA